MNRELRRYASKYLVHDEHKFVYFVLRKVACTSVKTALLPLFDLDPTPFEKVDKDGTRRLRVHKLFNTSGYQINKDQLLARLDREYREYFKFAFVRNPWDRLVSCYFNKVANKEKILLLEMPGGAGEERFYANMPFAEFVEAVYRTPDEEANPHFRSQYLTVCRSDGEPMTDFVGRFEQLREDFAHVAEEVGAPNLALPEVGWARSRDRGSRHYRDFYDGRLENLVQRRYEKDVEIFGYSF